MSEKKKQGIFNLANAVTSLRLFGAIALIFITPLTLAFYIIYSICGLSDAIDGTIARRMGTASEFGARLDSVSDISFYLVMFIKIMPVLWAELPVWIWYIVAAVLVVRLAAYGIAAVKYHRFAAIHTYMNKLTGGMVFLIPFMLLLPWQTALCAATALVALIASAEEFVIHACSTSYQGDKKSIYTDEEQ